MNRVPFFVLTTLLCLMIAQPSQAADTVVGTVKVHEEDANGDTWDPFGGAPDLRVDVRPGGIFGRTVSTDVRTNAFSATYNQGTISVKRGDIIRIYVYDVDPFGPDDLIGEYTTTITDEHLQNGLTLRGFGRVKSLSITFE